MPAWNNLESYMVGIMSAAIHVVLAQHEERRSKGSNDVAPLVPKPRESERRWFSQRFMLPRVDLVLMM